ncbi:signal peptide peptidase SppA [Ruminococcaceae bacterium OttesenSCG-928-N02]|nr:signal peptide peptidase SppA [Ruminococcaceae bacterium OttesenSCG-928-N02]
MERLGATLDMQYKKKEINWPLLVLVGVLLLLSFFGYRIGRGFNGTSQATPAAPAGNYFAIVRVAGTIQNTSADFATSVAYNHNATINYINQLAQDPSNKGIFLDLDTPGGTVYETDELYLALLAYTEQTGRPIWAYMNHQACSGGYYAAMAAEHVMANRNTTTGSIGVIISINDYSALYDTLGIHTDYIVSGPNKAMGAADTPLTEEQRAIYQSIVDESYAQFTDIVSTGRDMALETLLPLADGRIYTAAQALQAGLIDEITTREEALAAFEEHTGAGAYYRSFTQYSFLDRLFAQVADITPKSDAEVIAELLANAQDGTAFYLMP